MKRDKSDRFRAGTEMLMEPHHWRHKETIFMPVDPLLRFTFFPHQGIAFAVYDNDVESRTVTMSLFVCAGGPTGEMKHHHRPSKANPDSKHVVGTVLVFKRLGNRLVDFRGVLFGEKWALRPR